MLSFTVYEIPHVNPWDVRCWGNMARGGGGGWVEYGGSTSQFVSLLIILMFCLRAKPRPNDRNIPTQHVATCCVRLAAVLRCVATCWMLFAQIWNWSNLSQQHPTCRNTVAKRTQHVAPNNVAACCVGMLRSFGRGLTWLMGGIHALHRWQVANWSENYEYLNVNVKM